MVCMKFGTLLRAFLSIYGKNTWQGFNFPVNLTLAVNLPKQPRNYNS